MIKKIFSVVLVCVMIFSFAACGQSAYSSVLDDNGFFKNITATEYFTMTDMDEIGVSQEEIDAEIEYLVTNAFPNDDPVYYTEGVVLEDSCVNIDYVGKVDGEEFDGGNTNGEGTEVDIANTEYIDGFLPQLVGHSVGETFDINVTFPEEYENNEELAGKDAVFTITINSIVEHHYTAAEFTDEFVQENLSDIMSSYYGVTLTTADDYIEFIKESDIESQLYSCVEWDEEAQLPEDLLSWMNEVTIENLRAYAASNYGVELITYLKNYEDVESKEEYLETNAEDIEDELKELLKNQAIAEYYSLSVSEEELSEYFDGETNKSLEDVEKDYGMPYLKQYLLNETIVDKVIEVVLE